VRLGAGRAGGFGADWLRQMVSRIIRRQGSGRSNDRRVGRVDKLALGVGDGPDDDGPADDAGLDGLDDDGGAALIAPLVALAVAHGDDDDAGARGRIRGGGSATR
jgi:hypothetical protein